MGFEPLCSVFFGLKMKEEQIWKYGKLVGHTFRGVRLKKLELNLCLKVSTKFYHFESYIWPFWKTVLDVYARGQSSVMEGIQLFQKSQKAEFDILGSARTALQPALFHVQEASILISSRVHSGSPELVSFTGHGLWAFVRPGTVFGHFLTATRVYTCFVLWLLQRWTVAWFLSPPIRNTLAPPPPPKLIEF